MNNELDIHKHKPKYAKFKERINKLNPSPAKNILTKYAEWHDNKLEKNEMSYSSAIRSLEIAYRICDHFPKPQEITQKQIETWFEKETNRKALRRTGGDSIKQTEKNISRGTIEKTQSQLLKFLKFVDFLKLDKPLMLFSSKRMPIPLTAQFVCIGPNNGKHKEPPLVSQEQIKELIDYLLSTGNYIDRVAGVLVAYLNDTGNRLSEALTLRHENLIHEDGYWLAQIQQSKTKTRTNVILLSKEYLSKWLASCPSKNDKKGLVFCSKTGGIVGYSALRKALKDALVVKGVGWKDYSSFHYLRHLCASRLFDMPQQLIEYYLGWESKGMRAVYSAYNWRACLPFLLKSVRGNPMVDVKLSYMDEKEQDFVKVLEEELYQKIKTRLGK